MTGLCLIWFIRLCGRLFSPINPMAKKHQKRDPKVVSFTMSHIRGKNTGIELSLREALYKEGFRYRCNSGAVYGHPDLVNSRYKIAIFADSEFWHGYHFEEQKKQIRTHKAYWIPKIERNIARDEQVNAELEREGYTVLRYWGQQIEKHLSEVVSDVLAHLDHLKAIEALRGENLVKTTLCYIEKDDSYLMLYRNKKQNDLNEGKWIGVGGHVESGESIVGCLKREVKEETGLVLTHFTYRGYIDFLNDRYDPERMYLYTADGFTGEQIVCDEGSLSWIKKDQIMSLNLWEGDKVFLPLLQSKTAEPFHLTLIYHDNVLSEVLGPFYPAPKK